MKKMPNFENLCDWFDNINRVIVSVSGGVDSALVAAAAYKMLGSAAVAVTADYKTLSADEMDSAKSICKEIGIQHTMIRYNELDNPNFVINDKTRCYHCRTELSGRLVLLASKLGIETIVDGTNMDDLGDYRPGIDAMKENGISSPLVECKFLKDDVRREAKELGMIVWDRPSNSCLASRVPWGTKVTAERLCRIELAETVVKNSTGARQVRVRDIGGAARDPLILLKVDFDKASQLVKEFQNIQYFCTKDVNDDRLQDIIIKGDMLEKTPQYKEFVEAPDTKGDLNYLGITIDGKILYIGRDGSIYSRNNFSKFNITNIVYTLLNRISSIHAFHKTLDVNY
ncbi:MAG: ATP-utilizing protein [Cenarchaeum symbiont of Oopsacas minuta]|nr:ATP-utilizing protein [Cenarchaeum symbiont of Oopsacas minuta]